MRPKVVHKTPSQITSTKLNFVGSMNGIKNTVGGGNVDNNRNHNLKNSSHKTTIESREHLLTRGNVNCGSNKASVDSFHRV